MYQNRAEFSWVTSVALISNATRILKKSWKLTCNEDSQVIYFTAKSVTCFAASFLCQSVTQVKNNNSSTNMSLMKNKLVMQPHKGWAVPLVALAHFQPFVLSIVSVAAPQWLPSSTSIYKRQTC